MARLIAFIVSPCPILGEKSTPVNMQGRHLKDNADAKKWLFEEVPRSRPDLKGLRIDVVDFDEPLDRGRGGVF